MATRTSAFQIRSVTNAYDSAVVNHTAGRFCTSHLSQFNTKLSGNFQRSAAAAAGEDK